MALEVQAVGWFTTMAIHVLIGFPCCASLNCTYFIVFLDKPAVSYSLFEATCLNIQLVRASVCHYLVFR